MSLIFFQDESWSRTQPIGLMIRQRNEPDGFFLRNPPGGVAGPFPPVFERGPSSADTAKERPLETDPGNSSGVSERFLLQQGALPFPIRIEFPIGDNFPAPVSFIFFDERLCLLVGPGHMPGPL